MGVLTFYGGYLKDLKDKVYTVAIIITDELRRKATTI